MCVLCSGESNLPGWHLDLCECVCSFFSAHRRADADNTQSDREGDCGEGLHCRIGQVEHSSMPGTTVGRRL